MHSHYSMKRATCMRNYRTATAVQDRLGGFRVAIASDSLRSSAAWRRGDWRGGASLNAKRLTVGCGPKGSLGFTGAIIRFTALKIFKSFYDKVP